MNNVYEFVSDKKSLISSNGIIKEKRKIKVDMSQLVLFS